MSTLDPSIPIGGSTGACHETTAAVDEAVAYLVAVQPHERPRPLVPALRVLFNLTPLEACVAIAESNRIRRVDA